MRIFIYSILTLMIACSFGLYIYTSSDSYLDDGYTDALSCASSENETIMIDYDANNWDGSEMSKQDAIELMQLDMNDLDGGNWICE